MPLFKQSRSLAIILPVIFSIITVGGSKYLSTILNSDTSDGIFIFSNFIIVPLLMGMISAYCVRDLNYRNMDYFINSLTNAALAILFSYIFLKEGTICLVIISPLIIALISAGTFLGKSIYKKKNNTLNVSISGLLVLIMLVDVFSKHQYDTMVSDTMIINAPVEAVWPLVVEYEPIQAKEEYWLFKLGMPSPKQSAVDGYCNGAGRKCIFSNGYAFDEKIVEYEPNKKLTFDIIHQPRDPEIMGHIDIVRGQFILKDNGNGTTTLTGNSWYKLYVFPVWYFDTWAESITRNVHIRVMKHIKEQSEKHV